MMVPGIEMTSTQRDDGKYNVEIVLTGTRSQLESLREELMIQLQEKGILVPGEITYHQIQ